MNLQLMESNINLTPKKRNTNQLKLRNYEL